VCSSDLIAANLREVLVGRTRGLDLERHGDDDAWVGIPMMPISHSDLMPIRSERSDAGLSQCETVIGIRQEFGLLSWS
jgi:hypothetical protein